MDATTATIKDYILTQFLPGESPDALTETTPLITGKLLDSLATLKLVAFLEETYGVRLDAHEISGEYLDTIVKIAGLVRSKL